MRLTPERQRLQLAREKLAMEISSSISSARQRIAFVVHKFPPESIGGTEIYTWSLAQELARSGHEIHIFYPTTDLIADEEHIMREGVHLWRVPLPENRQTENPVSQYWHTFRDAGIEASYQRFWAAVRPELVHFQHVQGVSARLIELTTDVPRIVTLHDYWYFCANSQLVRPERTPCNGPDVHCSNCVDCATARTDLQWMRSLRPLLAFPFAYRNHYLRRVAKLVDVFISPSQFLRDVYVQNGFPAEKIAVIENGLDEHKLAPSTDLHLPKPAERPHFGFIGSLAWQKGVHILVEAFNRLDETVSLTIYGSEAIFPTYVEELKSLARHPHIHFAGPLQPHHVGDALRHIDCLVVPSLWYENSPLVIQEAYGVGTPVIASRLGALPEKIKRADQLFTSGDVDDLASLLQRLAQQPQCLAEMARPAAPSMAEHAAQLLSLYQHVSAAVSTPRNGDRADLVPAFANTPNQ